MGNNNTGDACCRHCGAELHLFTIFNKDMQALCRIWKRRHERGCAKRTPLQRRAWAKKYLARERGESSLVVDLEHPGFALDPAQMARPTDDDVAKVAKSMEERTCSVGGPRGARGIVEHVYRGRRADFTIRAKVLMESGTVRHVDVADVYCY